MSEHESSERQPSEHQSREHELSQLQSEHRLSRNQLHQPGKGQPDERGEHRNRAALWTKDFLLISSANLAVFAGFQMLMPTMPVYVRSLGGTETMMGLVIGIFTLSAVAIRPPGGVGAGRGRP